MTEQNNQQNQENTFTIQRIYIKDISFETPNVPEIFQKEWKPEVNIELNTASKMLSDNLYEVSLRITLTTKSNGDIAYICEVTQSGVFSVAGFSEQQLQHCLGAFCPSILFPYARETISGLVNKGTFQPMNLEHVNFDMLFMNYIQQQQSNNTEQSANPSSNNEHLQ